MTQTNLRQCFNTMVAVGTLKSKEVKFGTTDNGDSTITLILTLVSSDNDKINEHKISFWAKNTSKLYKSYVTVANEYKTIEEHGAEADKIKITGSLEMNEYYSSNTQELKTFNKLKGVFVNRLDKDLKDEVGAVVESIITSLSDEIVDGIPTGRKKVGIMTIGYNSSIYEIQNVFVDKELAQQFAQMYPLNSTGKLFLKINSYAEVVEKQEEKTSIGFGTTLSNMPDTEVKNYINEILIIGADTPNVANRFTIEQIGEIKQQREMSRQEKISTVPSTPPAPSGFGAGFGMETGTSTISDDDLPF